MVRPLPNLNQLRAFESAARHLSFKLAAEELNVTPAAISHQIKALEEDLGVELFRRITRGVKLLPGAETFALALSKNFGALAEAAAILREGHQKPLRVSCLPAYGMRILLPRLAGFRRKHPDIDLAVNLEAAFANFDNSDAAVRYGLGKWSDHSSQLLHRDVLSPVCAPQLVKGLRLPLDLARVTRLPVARSPGGAKDWKVWLKAAGHRGQIPETFREFENRAVVLDYLLTGNGIALLDLRFAATELASGRLVRLHPATSEGVNGIYLVHPKTNYPDQRITAFGAWLSGEAASVDITQGCRWKSY